MQREQKPPIHIHIPEDRIPSIDIIETADPRLNPDSDDAELSSEFCQKQENKAWLADPGLRKIVFSVAIVSGGIVGYKALRRYLGERTTGGLDETEILTDLEATGEEMLELPLEKQVRALIEHIQTIGSAVRKKETPATPKNHGKLDTLDIGLFTRQATVFLEDSLTAEPIDPEQKRSIIDRIRTTSAQASELLKTSIAGKKVHEDTAIIILAMKDPDAFALLYEKYLSTIYRYLSHRLGFYLPEREEVLLDLTHEVVTKAYAALKQKRFELTGAPFAPFLIRIAHNHLANWLRQHTRYTILPLEIQDLSIPNQPEIAAIQASDRDSLQRAIDQLPPDRQLLLRLKFGEGLTNREIAELMGTTEGAIKSLYHRTLVQLRKILATE